MKVTFNGGLISLTAETKEENQKLFDLSNEANFTPTGKLKQKYTKSLETTRNKHSHFPKPQTCPVEGCGKVVKNVGVHMHLKHGIDKEGNVHDTFRHNRSGIMPVGMPVVKLPNGTYRLRKSGGLLS